MNQKKEQGVRRWKSGWQAYVQADGRTFYKSFPSNTPIYAMREWRQQVARERRLLTQFEMIDQTALKPSLAGWCYVYFVRSGNSVKIGRAVDVADRLRSLQTAQSGDLHLIAAVPAHAALETAIQLRFKHLRQRGEWFRLDDELVRFIHFLRTGRNPLELIWPRALPVPIPERFEGSEELVGVVAQ